MCVGGKSSEQARLSHVPVWEGGVLIGRVSWLRV